MIHTCLLRVFIMSLCKPFDMDHTKPQKAYYLRNAACNGMSQFATKPFIKKQMYRSAEFLYMRIHILDLEHVFNAASTFYTT